jgi:outer membrane protein OmpA-like peptidoglycan-associated protein
MDGDQKKYQWGELVNLGPGINTEKGWESQPTLSGDGQTLFFTGVRDDSMKDVNGNPTHDLYYSERQADGTWGPAKNMGAPINTNKHEKGPFMHSDSKTLYFSSNGHIGAGAMDFFYTRMNDNGSWEKPKNLGVPVNSEADEIGIVVTSDGEVAYFAAKNFRDHKGWDVFQFAMPEKARPEKVMILKGEVLKDDGTPPTDASVELKYAQSGEKQKVQVNTDDGSYATVVKISKKEDVTVSVKGEGVAFNTRVVARANEDTPPVVTKLNMKTEELKADKPFVINDIYYSTNKADIEERSKIILDEFAAYLLENPTMTIEIRGHTDNVGNDQANFALSADRAFEVLKYLSSKGVPGKRMTAKGFGETKPVASNDTDEGRALNRRTEFMIKSL